MHEKSYIATTGIGHRKKFGQFFTPPAVARLMAEWVLQNRPERILDPAFGLGVFYDEIRKNSESDKLNFTACEIDPQIITHLKQNRADINIQLMESDYLSAHLPLFNAIICNPPYMRFQKFQNRHLILPKLEQQIGDKIKGHTNIAGIFLLKAINELAENGSLAFIMPLEFFNTGYGTAIKKKLLENGLLKQIIIIDDEKRVFPEATTTICILLCRKNNLPEPIIVKQLHSIDNSGLVELKNSKYQEILPSALPCHKKWSPLLCPEFAKLHISDQFIPLSYYGLFKRGLATGANEFFAFSESKMKKWQLDKSHVSPCLTKSAQIRKPIFTEEDFKILRQQDRPVYCLNICASDNKQLRDYLKYGETEGFHERYLTRMRKPWYRMEKREAAPILCGVFSRGRCKIIRNLTPALNFTCFHGFYPNQIGQKLLEQLYIYLISDTGQKAMKMNKRSYGEKLDKFEPGDLNECLCPTAAQLGQISPEEAQRVIELAKKTPEAAIQASNLLIARILHL